MKNKLLIFYLVLLTFLISEIGRQHHERLLVLEKMNNLR
jgi:hypothetical protein